MGYIAVCSRFCRGIITMSITRRTIQRFLGKNAGVDVVGECGDGESAVGAIRERKPDLVFLDVQAG